MFQTPRRSNKCYATRQTSLEVLDLLIGQCDSLPDTEHTDELSRHFLEALFTDLNQHHSHHLRNNFWYPGFFEYHQIKARLCLKHLFDHRVPRSVFSNLSKDQTSNLSHQSKSLEDLEQCKSMEDEIAVVKSFLNSPIYEVKEGCFVNLSLVCLH